MAQPRPVIGSLPASVTYGQSMTIQTSQAPQIRWVSLIRPSANTHSCDTEQRLIDLPITARTSTALTVTVTGNRNLAPPGYYMVFISDNNVQPGVPNGVPSQAEWMHLG